MKEGVVLHQTAPAPFALERREGEVGENGVGNENEPLRAAEETGPLDRRDEDRMQAGQDGSRLRRKGGWITEEVTSQTDPTREVFSPDARHDASDFR